MLVVVEVGSSLKIEITFIATNLHISFYTLLTTRKTMKKIILASLLAATSMSNAFAVAITSLPDGTLLNMATLNYFGTGPQALDSNTVWTSDTANSVYGYTNGYGFANNGYWSGVPMVGVNSSGNTMTFTFTQAVVAFGGFMNFAPGYGNAVIAAYDTNGSMLDSTTLTFNTNGTSNSGEFHGFRQNTASIKTFTMSGSYIGGSNFAVVAVPEPETYAMMLAGLAGLGFMARRRKA